MANNNKPPSCKPAWTHQQAKEPLKKNIRTEKETKIKSQRQRSYSEVENVEILYSVTQSRDKTKCTDKRDNPVLSRSKSEDGLDSQDTQSRDNVLTERSGTSTLSDGNTSTTRSKFTSREPVVKSQKPITKPLHLGKVYVCGAFQPFDWKTFQGHLLFFFYTRGGGAIVLWLARRAFNRKVRGSSRIGLYIVL